MVEVMGAATAIGVAAMTARLGVLLGARFNRSRDEFRFARGDRIELDEAFARIVASEVALED